MISYGPNEWYHHRFIVVPNRTQAGEPPPVTFAARAGSHHICKRHHDTGEWLAILEVDDGEVLEIGEGEERWHR